MAEFTRKEDAMYNIPQRFADTNLKKCPFCGEKNRNGLSRSSGSFWEKITTLNVRHAEVS